MKDGMDREFSEHPGDLVFKYNDLDNETKYKPLFIRVEGFKGGADDPDGHQIMIEVYEGKLFVRVWTDGAQDPQIIKLPMKESFESAIYADKAQLPLLINDEDLDVQALVKRRLGKD